MQTIDYKTYKKYSAFLRLPEGDSIIRVVSEGITGYKHEMKLKTGRFIPLGECKGLSCVHCKKGSEAKLYFRWIAFNRVTQEAGVFEPSKNIADFICSESQKMGVDAKEIDFLIHREGLKKEDTKYKISKSPQTKELSDEEKKIIMKDYYKLLNKYFKNESI